MSSPKIFLKNDNPVNCAICGSDETKGYSIICTECRSLAIDSPEFSKHVGTVKEMSSTISKENSNV